MLEEFSWPSLEFDSYPNIEMDSTHQLTDRTAIETRQEQLGISNIENDTSASNRTTRSLGRGRGIRGRSSLAPPPGPRNFITDLTAPVSSRTRATGSAEFLGLPPRTRTCSRQGPSGSWQPDNAGHDVRRMSMPQCGVERDVLQEPVSEFERIAQRMNLSVAERENEQYAHIRLQNEQYMEDVEYYFTNRAKPYLAGEGRNIRCNLSPSELEALQSGLKIIRTLQGKVDDNFRLMRHSLSCPKSDIQEHEEWHQRVDMQIGRLQDQCKENERTLASTTAIPSPVLNGPPQAWSEAYINPVIEPLKLDTFSGALGTYRAFKARFNLIMKKGRVDEALQAEHLIKCLDKQPLRMVYMIDLEERNAIKHIWDTLDSAYGNAQCEYQQHVTELQRMANYPQCKTDSDLTELYYKFSEHIYKLQRISNNPVAGDDYKTILCNLLPEYLRRKVNKLMFKTPEDYTLSKVLRILKEQIDICNVSNASGGFPSSKVTSGASREIHNPWDKSRMEAEKRAQAYAGRVENVFNADGSNQTVYGECSNNNGANQNFVTVGDTFAVPGPIASVCYPTQRSNTFQPHVNHYSFREKHNMSNYFQAGENHSTPKYGNHSTPNYGNTFSGVPNYMQSPSVNSLNAYNDLSEPRAYMSGLPPNQSGTYGLEHMRIGSNLESSQVLQAHVARTNTQKPPPGRPSVIPNHTVKLELPDARQGCVFCGGGHGSLDCRAFSTGAEYCEILRRQGLCFNCFCKGHVLAACTVDSTCKMPACSFSAKHCPFYCGSFKFQTRGAYMGSVQYSVGIHDHFDSVRLHTVLFFIVNPETGKETLARGFLDGGCSDTFMKRTTAQGADLPGLSNKIRFVVTSFGGLSEETEGSLVKVMLKSLSGNFITPVITCITKEQLVQDLDSYQLTKEQITCIDQNGYHLSDTGATASGTLPVDMVIGQDLYYQLVKGAPITLSGGLVLINTVFGHALGGPVQSVIEGQVKSKVMHYAKCKIIGGLEESLSSLHGENPITFSPTSVSNYMDGQIAEANNNAVIGMTCLFCGGDHSSLDCYYYPDGSHFMDILKSQNRCFNCFSGDHVVYFCPNESTCIRADCRMRGKHCPFRCRNSQSLCGSNVPSSSEGSCPGIVNVHKVKNDTAVSNIQLKQCKANVFRLSAEEEQDSLKRLTDLETLGILPDGKEDSPVLDRFNSEVRKDNHRYVIKLPWKNKRKSKLRSNFKLAFERTNSSYEKLSKPAKQDSLEKYNKIMMEQVETGILEEVADLGTIAEVRQRLNDDPYYYDHFMPCHEESAIHYLPHHGVLKAVNQKLRIVYDASARPFKGAYSLNDCLETGPSLIQSLSNILIRFRLKKCAYVADIAKAFLQVVVDPCDRDSLRLLWRRGEHIVIYRFNRLPFGLSSSPFILAATLKHLFEESQYDNEEIQAILRSFYVDDLVSSEDSEEEVLKRRDHVQGKLEEASMKICKWNSNSLVLKGFFASSEVDTLPNEESVLGMVWDTVRDVISVNNSRVVKNLSNNNTKEELYSVIAQVFDPMGLLSPFVFLAKILLHKACLAKLDWKSKLPPGLNQEWEVWKADISKINEIQYDRWISFEGATDFELHGFCDASADGFAAVVYLVSKGKNKVQSRLLTSKTRVNSGKKMTMPRLELCATVLLSRLMDTASEVVNELHISRKVYYTDSMNALHWIVSDHYSWPIFVANRIKQVRSLTDSVDWRYVNTRDNPADLPSRGCLTDGLKDSRLWKEGPRFLISGEPPYLGKMDLDSMPEGCRTEYPRVSLAAVVGQADPCLNLRKLIPLNVTNSYHKLMKITKLVYKAVALMRVKSHPVDPEQWARDKIELDWIRTVQAENFEHEIGYCKVNEHRTHKLKPSLVRSLSLIWDTDSRILRCSTRLKEANLGYASTNPILLPRDDEFTTMLAMAVHQRVGHVGVKQTLSAIRSEFWVPKARQMIKSLIHRCVKCRRVSAPAFDLPPAPPLPVCRVGMSRPFSNLGIDFCGPFNLKGHNKWYVAVFTCAVTRAVHFEALSSLSVDSFLLAFKRFIGRRGVPELIISDNAKTFKSVARKLKAIFDNPALQKYLIERRVKWHFYVERAPWHGGFIERVVGLFKGVFKKLVGQTVLNVEEFRTLVVASEQVVNSRPLTYLYDNINDGEPLTPAKLLHGYNLTDLPPLGKGGYNEAMTITTRAKLLERIQNRFWNMWSKDYLQELSERHFAQKAGKDNIREPKEGEVVLLKGEHLPRNRWKLGVIKHIYRSSRDQKIRTVVVRIPEGKGHKGGEYRRSPKHVVPLEAELA